MNRLNVAFYAKTDKKMRCMYKKQRKIKKRTGESSILRRELDFHEVNDQEMTYKKEIMRFQSYCRPRLQVSSVVCFFVGLQNVYN